MKGQIRSAGLTEIAKRNASVFEATMTPAEFCERYKAHLVSLNIFDGSDIAKVEAVRAGLSLRERDIVVGTYKVS